MGPVQRRGCGLGREFAKNFKTPTLVIYGQMDYRLDVREGLQLFTTLQRMGMPSKMLYFPDEGHWVLKPQNSQLWYKTVNDWVDRRQGDEEVAGGCALEGVARFWSPGIRAEGPQRAVPEVDEQPAVATRGATA